MLRTFVASSSVDFDYTTEREGSASCLMFMFHQGNLPDEMWLMHVAFQYLGPTRAVRDPHGQIPLSASFNFRSETQSRSGPIACGRRVGLARLTIGISTTRTGASGVCSPILMSNVTNNLYFSWNRACLQEQTSEVLLWVAGSDISWLNGCATNAEAPVIA
jgi:hypothetical protein